MTRFAVSKLPGNSKTVSKRQNVKTLLETEALIVKYLWKCPYLFTSFIASRLIRFVLCFTSEFPANLSFELYCVKRAVKAFCKVLATGSDVGFCV